MILSKYDIEELPRIKRLNLINSLSGIKAACLIGTADRDGKTNVAIFNSVIHLSTQPPLMGFVMRPNQEVRRHTLENIEATGQYTVNHVNVDFYKKAHYTSAKFDAGVSEFDACGLTVEYLAGFDAPFVHESELKIGLEHRQTLEIELNGTKLIVGEVKHLIFPEEIMNEKGRLNYGLIDTVGVSGLNLYYTLEKLDELEYARVGDFPEFESEAHEFPDHKPNADSRSTIYE
jgi:flavin reductase (DIM6/NTAB) family NADH-FMN oxidoreductase RutF